VAGKLGRLGKPGGGRKCVNVAAHAHCPKAKVKSNLQRQVPKMCFLWSIMLTQLTAKIYTQNYTAQTVRSICFVFGKVKIRDFTFHCRRTFAIGQKVYFLWPTTVYYEPNLPDVLLAESDVFIGGNLHQSRSKSDVRK